MAKFHWHDYKGAWVLRADDNLIGYLYGTDNPMNNIYYVFHHYGNADNRLILITGSDLENAKRETEKDILKFMDRCLRLDIENMKENIEILRGNRAKINIQIDAMDSSQAR